MKMFIGHIRELKDFAQELPAFQKSQTMQLEAAYKFQSEQESSGAVYVFAPGIFLNTPRPDFQIFSRRA